MRKSRLDVVARLRLLEERKALAAATHAQRAVAEAEQASMAARGAYDSRPLPSGSVTPGGLASVRLQALGALELVSEASAKVQQAEHVHAQAADVVKAASIRRKSADRLLERRQLELKQLAAIAEMKAADENSVLSFARPDQRADA